LLNPHPAEEKAKGIRMAEWLAAQKADEILLCKDLSGKEPPYVFREAGIELRLTQAAELPEALALGFSQIEEAA